MTIIDTCDYEDYKTVVDAITSLGFKPTLIDNGNTVLEKTQ